MKPKTKRVAAATIFAEYADTIVADLGEDIFVEAYNAIAAAGRESHPDRVIGRCVDCCNNFFMTSSKWAGSWYAKLAKEEATRLERTGEAFWLALKATARKRDLPQIAQHLQAILQLVPEREHAPPRSDVEQAVAKLLQRAGVRHGEGGAARTHSLPAL